MLQDLHVLFPYSRSLFLFEAVNLPEFSREAQLFITNSPRVALTTPGVGSLGLTPQQPLSGLCALAVPGGHLAAGPARPGPAASEAVGWVCAPGLRTAPR